MPRHRNKRPGELRLEDALILCTSCGFYKPFKAIQRDSGLFLICLRCAQYMAWFPANTGSPHASELRDNNLTVEDVRTIRPTG